MDGYDSTLSLGQRLNEDGDCAASVYLLVLDGDTSSIFQLPHAGLTVIGRAPDADLRVQHSSVSRQHAAFTRDDEGVLRVADLGSHNGT
jgi:pSer/pThr/pTyr-binding forkhead associated (FHA) protein